MRSISIIIPAYNEEKRLPKTLQKVIDFLSKQAYRSEIIIVDDSSTDDTYQIAKSINCSSPKISLKVVQHGVNKGKGAAVKTGVMASTSDYVLFMDADGSTDITELKKLLPYLKSHDVIIGSRYLEEDSVKIKQPLSRRIISRTGNMLIRSLLDLNYADTQCGFKLFEANCAKKIFSRACISRWAFDIEILTIAQLHDCLIKEVAVDWYDSPDSKLRAGRAASRTLSDALSIKQNLRSGKYQ